MQASDLYPCNLSGKVRLSSHAATIAKGLSLCARLITIPICIKMLGAGRYGLWLAVTSLLSWLTLTDFGISAGLLHVLSHRDPLKDKKAAQQYISSSYFLFCIFAMVVFAGTLIASNSIAVTRLLLKSSNTAARAELGGMIATAGVLLAVNIPATLVGQVVSALQESYIGSFSFIASTVLSLISLALFRNLPVGLREFTLIWYLPPIICSLSTFGYVFFCRYPTLRPSLSGVTRSTIGELRTVSGTMFLLQAAEVAGSYASNVIIAVRCGPSEVTSFSVMYSLAMAGPALAYNFVAPLWPAFRNASRRGEYEWIKSEAKRYFGRALCAVIGWAVLLAAGAQFFVKVWTHSRVTTDQAEVYAISIWIIVLTTNVNLRLLSNGLNMIRMRVFTTTASVLAFAALSWFLSPTLGGSGVATAGTLVGVIESLVLWRLIGLRLRSDALRITQETVTVA